MISKNLREIVKRYSKALLQNAIEANLIIEFEEIAIAVNHLIKSNNEFREFLSNRMLTIAQKQEIMLKIMSKINAPQFFTNAMLLLVKNRRINLLKHVIENSLELIVAHRGEEFATIISAAPISDIQHKILKDKLEKALGKKISAKYQVDPELLYGLIVRVGNLVIDNSLANKLRKIRIHSRSVVRNFN
jgi:F-type H+-transporting ATPase subunit delta